MTNNMMNRTPEREYMRGYADGFAWACGHSVSDIAAVVAHEDAVWAGYGEVAPEIRSRMLAAISDVPDVCEDGELPQYTWGWFNAEYDYGVDGNVPKWTEEIEGHA